MSQAWHTAAFTRVPKFPDLKSVLTQAPPSQPQTGEEQFAVFAAMAARSQR